MLTPLPFLNAIPGPSRQAARPQVLSNVRLSRQNRAYSENFHPASSVKRIPGFACGSRAHFSCSAVGRSSRFGDTETESFDDYDLELQRRKRKADFKLRRKSGYVSNLVVTVRGGKGGSGAAAFMGSRSGGIGPPSGGDGGTGGHVLLTTSPHLSDLSTVPKRLIGGQGSNAAGGWKHGKRGNDLVVQVPIGTIIREIRREGEEERWERDLAALGIGNGLSDKEERRRRQRERWYIKHPGGEVSDDDFTLANGILKREGFFAPSPTFDELPPLDLDLAQPLDKPLLLSRGGKGGLGNPHFHIPSTAAGGSKPARLASRGVQPPTLTFELELKLLADVGLVGFPNAGKSTILRALTGRKAEVAGYSFTTLNPQVGVVRVWDDGSWGTGTGSEAISASSQSKALDGNGSAEMETNDFQGTIIEESEIERAREAALISSGEYIPPPPRHSSLDASKRKVERIRFTISDNPGLLPQASANVGLGHTFLRHLERCRLHVYVLDLGRDDPAADLKVLREEMEAWLPGLSMRDAVVVLNKGDDVDEDVGRGRVEGVKDAVGEEGLGWEVVTVSAKFGLGLGRLVDLLGGKMEAKRVEEGSAEQ